MLVCSYCRYYGTRTVNPSLEHLESHPVTGVAVFEDPGDDHFRKVRRWAVALRGRKGSDVWERFLAVKPARQREYLIQNGVPELNVDDVLAELKRVLAADRIAPANGAT